MFSSIKISGDEDKKQEAAPGGGPTSVFIAVSSNRSAWLWRLLLCAMAAASG